MNDILDMLTLACKVSTYAILIYIAKITIEIGFAQHCDRWTKTPYGDRCIEPREQARGFELIHELHPIAFGVLTCGGNCDKE